MFYEVIPEGKVEALTYCFDDSLLVGQIVLVPIGVRTVPGVVVKKVAQPKFATKKILQVLYTKPLPRHLLDAVQFIHAYYLVPSGTALGVVLPNGVQKQRRKQKTEQMFGKKNNTSGPWSPTCITLNPHQKKALEGLCKAPGATKLLFGVTGSGKTNIYLEMATRALIRQKSSIVLVPEIALTGQLLQVFQEAFGDKVVVMHSKQTEAERHLIFNSLLNANEPKIVVGPRSALFAPLADLGLIVIDEEHEGTYYQENTPKYSAIRVASRMANRLGIDLVLGSATPTIEDYYLALHRNSLIEITEKAKSSAKSPEVKLIDFKNRDNFRKNRYFCDGLLAKISSNLEAGQQTLIFHNRRGSAPLTICENCGEELVCPNCFLPLTLHADNYELACHTCGFNERVPAGCPKCGHPGLVHKGFGTKLLASELEKLFPAARVRRFDADNKKGEGMETAYEEVREGKVDILVGTQTLAKGLDLPRLATVGVVQADAGLCLPDYLAEERTFQLLTQVMGRVGRGHLDVAEVFVQTFRPEHPVLNFALKEDYKGFYKYLITRRQKAGFPPFRFVMKLEITLKTEKLVVKKVRDAYLQLTKDQRLVVSPPQPAFHERTSRGFSWQIIVRAKSRQALVEACERLDKNFRVALDPPGLL